MSPQNLSRNGPGARSPSTGAEMVPAHVPPELVQEWSRRTSPRHWCRNCPGARPPRTGPGTVPEHVPPGLVQERSQQLYGYGHKAEPNQMCTSTVGPQIVVCPNSGMTDSHDNMGSSQNSPAEYERRRERMCSVTPLTQKSGKVTGPQWQPQPSPGEQVGGCGGRDSEGTQGRTGGDGFSGGAYRSTLTKTEHLKYVQLTAYQR